MRRLILPFLAFFVVILILVVFVFSIFPRIFLISSEQVGAQWSIQPWDEVITPSLGGAVSNDHYLSFGRLVSLRETDEGLVFLTLLHRDGLVEYLVGRSSRVSTLQVPFSEEFRSMSLNFATINYSSVSYLEMQSDLQRGDVVGVEIVLPLAEEDRSRYTEAIPQCPDEQCRTFLQFSLDSTSTPTDVMASSFYKKIITPDTRVFYEQNE